MRFSTDIGIDFRPRFVILPVMPANAPKPRTIKAKPAVKAGAVYRVIRSASGEVIMTDAKGRIVKTGGILKKKKIKPSAEFKLSISEETAARQVSITQDIAKLNLG